MGSVKFAVMEVEDIVSECIDTGNSLDETIAVCHDKFKETSNPYLTDKDFIKKIFYNYRGGEM